MDDLDNCRYLVYCLYSKGCLLKKEIHFGNKIVNTALIYDSDIKDLYKISKAIKNFIYANYRPKGPRGFDALCCIDAMHFVIRIHWLMVKQEILLATVQTLNIGQVRSRGNIDLYNVQAIIDKYLHRQAGKGKVCKSLAECERRVYISYEMQNAPYRVTVLNYMTLRRIIRKLKSNQIKIYKANIKK